MNKTSVKQEALMLLANGVRAEVITEDQAINVMLAMDDASKGNDNDLDAHATAILPILNNLHERYIKETRHDR